ncbi:putative reverse transcriptase domain, reverse transcriptase zinc-binding domain protein [Tanacetum coccineum]
MIMWIMECVSTTSFSISINGSLHGYFKGKRGLRQGDPLSPYLFTIVMEVLTLILKRRTQNSELFTYYQFCSRMELINLCFMDDLFLFAHGDANSAQIIMESLDEFKNVSGLVLSLPKSTAYFCNVLNHIKYVILQITPFKEGHLPVKYLGVPLVSSCLVFKDCKELIERVKSRLNDWKNKALSFAAAHAWVPLSNGAIRGGELKPSYCKRKRVSPWKGVIRFGKRGKLNPRYIRPFKIIDKKCMVDEPLAIPLDEIQIDDKLYFIEEHVEIMDREVKRLKQSRIPIVKVRWNSKRGPEFTWEREDQMQKKYPHLFPISAPMAGATS